MALVSQNPLYKGLNKNEIQYIKGTQRREYLWKKKSWDSFGEYQNFCFKEFIEEKIAKVIIGASIAITFIFCLTIATYNYYEENTNFFSTFLYLAALFASVFFTIKFIRLAHSKIIIIKKAKSEHEFEIAKKVINLSYKNKIKLENYFRISGDSLYFFSLISIIFILIFSLNALIIKQPEIALIILLPNLFMLGPGVLLSKKIKKLNIEEFDKTNFVLQLSVIYEILVIIFSLYSYVKVGLIIFFIIYFQFKALYLYNTLTE